MNFKMGTIYKITTQRNGTFFASGNNISIEDGLINLSEFYELHEYDFDKFGLTTDWGDGKYRLTYSRKLNNQIFQVSNIAESNWNKKYFEVTIEDIEDYLNEMRKSNLKLSKIKFLLGLIPNIDHEKEFWKFMEFKHRNDN